jgi:hypothetical protein
MCISVAGPAIDIDMRHPTLRQDVMTTKELRLVFGCYRPTAAIETIFLERGNRVNSYAAKEK